MDRYRESTGSKCCSIGQEYFKMLSETSHHSRSLWQINTPRRSDVEYLNSLMPLVLAPDPCQGIHSSTICCSVEERCTNSDRKWEGLRVVSIWPEIACGRHQLLERLLDSCILEGSQFMAWFTRSYDLLASSLSRKYRGDQIRRRASEFIRIVKPRYLHSQITEAEVGPLWMLFVQYGADSSLVWLGWRATENLPSSLWFSCLSVRAAGSMATMMQPHQERLIWKAEQAPAAAPESAPTSFARSESRGRSKVPIHRFFHSWKMHYIRVCAIRRRIFWTSGCPVLGYCASNVCPSL